MTTSMHRQQISLPQWQVEFLAERARREGQSMAEIIRRLIQREAKNDSAPADRGPLREAAGIAEYSAPPEGMAVGERPAPYLITRKSDTVSVILELSPEAYGRLRDEAGRLGKALPAIAREWLIERLAMSPAPPLDERAPVRQALRAAGLLTELGPELRVRADPTISLEEVQEALDRADGKPLSEIIIEQRGPKG